jgi:CDP-diacylglycerol---glycerol-3-phosphate 3-phosphatidyltransferase
MFNLANNITLARILAIPLLVVLLSFPNRFTNLAAMLVFIAAALTDLVDGLIARRYNLVTTVGKFLDPLADKLLIASVLIMLVDLERAPAWIVILIVGREIAVTGLRAMAVDQGLVIAADKYGKLKTIFPDRGPLPPGPARRLVRVRPKAHRHAAALCGTRPGPLLRDQLHAQLPSLLVGTATHCRRTGDTGNL